MADAAIAAKLQDAFEKIHKASAAKDGVFNDEAGDALAAARKAFREAVTKAPETLDNAQNDTDKVRVLNFLLKAQEKKTNRKNQVKLELSNLFHSEAWLSAAHKDEELKQKLLEFLSAFADMNEISGKLEEGPAPAAKGEAKRKPRAPASADSAAPASGDGAAEEEEEVEQESADDITRRYLAVGLEGLRECNFVYPTGRHTEQASDDALEAFNSNFYMGVTRLATAVGTLNFKKEDTSVQEGMLDIITDEEVPQTLNFMVIFWNDRKPYRNKVTYCVDKLAESSLRFKKAVEDRSGRTDRLPWLADMPEQPDYPAIGTMQHGATGLGHGLEAMRPINAGDVCTVVWIDGKPGAYTEAKGLFDVGINVKGFHDDWSRGPSNATQKAEEYLVEAIENPKEHIIAIIVNNGPTHKQMLKNIKSYNHRRGRPAPFCLACTMKGTYADFKDCGVTFINKDRKIVEAIAAEEMITRRDGGHKFSKDQLVCVFSASQGAWFKGKVFEVLEDGQVVVTYGASRKTIPPHDFGLWLRAPPSGSVFWSCALDAPEPPIETKPGYGELRAGYS